MSFSNLEARYMMFIPISFSFLMVSVQFSPRRPGSKRAFTEGIVAEGSNNKFPLDYLRLRFIALIQLHSNPHLLALPSQFSCLPMPKTRELRQKLFERKFGQFTRRSKIKKARKASKYQMQQIHKKE